MHIIEYAKSGRARCKDSSCGELIPKGSLRLGSVYYIINHKGISYKHWKCVTMRQLMNIGNVDELTGYESLLPEDQEKVIESLDRLKYYQSLAKTRSKEREKQNLLSDEQIEAQARVANEKAERMRKRKQENDRKIREYDLKVQARRQLALEQKRIKKSDQLQEQLKQPKKSVPARPVKKIPIGVTKPSELQIQTEESFQVGQKHALDNELTPGKRIKRLPLKLQW